MNKYMNNEASAHTVTSKYFSSKSDMDESLSDFKEPKKLLALKKAPKKAKAAPEKLKKAPKRIRGQKDIRTSLQTKKNELESYSKDFDHVCKQAGLDIDSEQLQLAIALSKSLQQPASTSTDNPETAPSLKSAQDRVGKIRSTLLEYGFKVPNIKIKTTKKLKKRKQYKLLLTSEDAKKQIITNKYSQVLFENIVPSNSQSSVVDVTHSHLYNLTTSAAYSILKSIDTFYIDDLLEKSSSTGILLRDWSEIPGRPVSPKLCEPSKMNFSEIECSQDELDIVLSGSLKSCKNILKQEKARVSEHKLTEQNELVCKNNLDNSVIVLLDDESTNSNDLPQNKEKIDSGGPKTVSKTLETNGSNTSEEVITVISQFRSCSPDIFDDEPSTEIDNITELFSQEKVSPLHIIPVVVSSNADVMDLTECVQENIQRHSIHINPNSQLSQNSNGTKKFDDFMEITECVEVPFLITNSTNKSETLKLSQNITKRKSNDFMEITNCVVNPVQTLHIAENIDLTQSPENNNMHLSGANIDFTDKYAIKTLNEIASPNHEAKVFQTKVDVNNTENEIENVALQLLDIEGTPQIISINKDINIDLTESPDLVKHNTAEKKADKSNESLDLTQSSNNSDDLPFVSLKNNKKELSSDETIIMDPKDYEAMNEPVVSQDNDEILDLTQTMHEEVNNCSQELQNNKVIQVIPEPPTIEIVHDCALNLQNPEDILDLTQEIPIKSRQDNETNRSFFDDYVHNHSDNKDVHEEVICNDNFFKGSDSKEISLDVDRDTSPQRVESSDFVYTQSPRIKSTANPNVNDDIDLTQTSESSEELDRSSPNNIHSKPRVKRNESKETTKVKIRKNDQSDIDLTQHSAPQKLTRDLRNKDSIGLDVDSDSDATNEIEIVKSSQRCSSLGKKNDVSIDYDDIYDNIINQHSCSQQSRNSSKSATNNSISNVSNKSKDISNCSQTSEVFVISDNELDYSMHKSKLEKPVDNFLFGGISIMDEFSGLTSYRRSTNIENNSAAANNIQVTVNVDDVLSNKIELEDLRKTPVKHKRVNELVTPQKPSCSGLNTVVTPSNSHYVIKTVDVTPMPKYDTMSLQELHNELDQFGVKPFKRKRAIQLLTHIYNQTHPTVESYSDEESPCKRQKINDQDSPQKPSRKITPRKVLSPKKTVKSPRNVLESNKSPRKVSAKRVKEDRKDIESNNIRLNDIEQIQISRNHEVNETPDIKEIECSPDDWVFQKREKAKIHSCRVPLHIAFHNYVSSRRGLKEAILCYEPINIDDIHKDLVAYGHRYDPKDLLKFMDKKCITVKTNDNDARNHRR